jgi:hypothetical protein
MIAFGLSSLAALRRRQHGNWFLIARAVPQGGPRLTPVWFGQGASTLPPCASKSKSPRLCPHGPGGSWKSAPGLNANVAATS